MRWRCHGQCPGSGRPAATLLHGSPTAPWMVIPGLAQQSARSCLVGRAPSRPDTAARPRRRGAVLAAAAGGRGEPDPYALLQVSRGASRRAIRAAYIERIKLLHPDVSPPGEDTTAAAAALNAAYEALMDGFSGSWDSEEEEDGDPLSVFDQPEAEPDQLFVNPFAVYNISPLQWEELQAAARAAEAAGQDPWSALQQQGVQCSEGAFVYLSPAQLAALEAELATASAAMDVIRMEAAAYFVSDCLLRARVANNRMPTSAGRWG